MATYFTEWGKLPRARELVTEAVGVFRCSGGIRLAVCLEALGQLEEARGHHTAALAELEAGGKVWDSCGPSRRRELVRNMLYRADLLDEMGRLEDSARLREKAAEVQAMASEPVLLPLPQAEPAADRSRKKLL
jgi:hypothetical protein